MPAVEILSVSPSPNKSDKLEGSHIDHPATGSELDGFEMRIIGWVVGHGAQAVAVAVLYDGHRIRMAPVREPRPDVGSLYPNLPEAAHSGYDFFVDALPLEPRFELRLEAVLEDGSAASIGSLRGRHGAPQATRESGHSVTPPTPPTLEHDLQELISAALTSRQGDAIASARTSRADLPDELDLRGKKVLDIGADIGDVSREARARGAALVDGLEADSELVSLARLLTAHRKVTRVSFHHRDLTSPTTYREHYDIVLALSVVPLLEPVIPQVAEITDGVLVTEPPSALAQSTASSLKACFPFTRTLRRSDTGNGRRRSLGVWAESEMALRSALRQQQSPIEASRP